MSGALHRRVVAAAVVLGAIGAVLLLSVSPGSAHAMLQATDPPDGADLEVAPAQVTLTFNEPVEAASDGLRVYDAAAARVDTGPIDDGGLETVAVGLPDDLPDGGYVVTYRVVSADSHPIAGVVTFTVGGAAAVDDALVAELFGGAGTSTAGIAGPILRGLGYVATLLAAGAVAIATVVARREEHRILARRVAVPSAVAGIVLAIAALPVHASAVAGVGVMEAATASRLLGDALDSGFGEGTLVRVIALAIIALLWLRPSPMLLVGIGAGAALGSYLRDGHQRTVEPAWALIPGDAVHLAAAATWFAGLVLLALILRATPPDDSPVPAARFLARFSTMALVTVALLAVSGATMAWPLVGSFGALTSTTYGWILLGKLSAVAAVVVIALYNRQRLVPIVVAATAPRGGSGNRVATDEEPTAEVPGTEAPVDGPAVHRFEAAWRALTSTVRLEAAVLVGVLAITGFLVSQQPAAEEAGLGGLYETSVPLGDDLVLDVVVDPNRVGLNAIHLYVLDPTGRPADGVEDVVLELTYVDEGIGPIVVEPLFAGPGHWIANTDDLRFAGDWQVRVVAGVDRFTEFSAEVTVPVAP